MGRIRILSDQVANQIAAGEVVDRPASVVKEMLENALDAGATRIRIEVEGGGRRLIRISDNGQGMGRDDALLAFERHATSKIRSSDDLLALETLGFRGEALPSIASVARLELETAEAGGQPGTRVEIAGGRILAVEECGHPPGTTIAVSELFYNTPARRKFLRAEQTELAHVTALVTHYALVHPDKHFELLSASHTLLHAPAVTKISERIYQVFGRDTLAALIPVAAELPLERSGLPPPPPWKREAGYQPPPPGTLRLSGFTAKPELQKLNRNSIYVFVNRRLIRDRLILHAVSEGYRNIIPPTSFPVALLFLEMPPAEVDVNVHPAKTEVRFRQPGTVHDLVRDSLRNALMLARPAASFVPSIANRPLHSSLLPAVSPLPGAAEEQEPGREPGMPAESEGAALAAEAAFFAPDRAGVPGRSPSLPFAASPSLSAGAAGVVGGPGALGEPDGGAVALAEAAAEPPASLNSLATLKPLGQLRESFILATNDEGLWIIDQHVAHERVLFEKVLREREVERVERQRLLMPMLVDLEPQQMVLFARIREELERNGFEAEPFGPRTVAVKAAPPGLGGAGLERMLHEVLEQTEREAQSENLETARTRIAASIACHSAIKINTPLDPERMAWLLAELGRTEHPTSCPHGRPIALRYAWKDIQRAFQRL